MMMVMQFLSCFIALQGQRSDEKQEKKKSNQKIKWGGKKSKQLDPISRSYSFLDIVKKKKMNYLII